jgi:hypothetical protein
MDNADREFETEFVREVKLETAMEETGGRPSRKRVILFGGGGRVFWRLPSSRLYGF